MLPNARTDPFGENTLLRHVKTLRILGANVRFASDSRRLITLAAQAFAQLPMHRVTDRIPTLDVHLRVTRAATLRRCPSPPLSMRGASGMLGGAPAGSSFVMISPSDCTALVSISSDLLTDAYQVRYEFIEFAVYTLASRVLGLVPLHAACIGVDGRGILLMGDSGAGKSTTTLFAALAGFECLAEDAVFIEPRRMLATGASNFLHATPGTLRWLDDDIVARTFRRSPLIRRRSGVEKYEIDLRRSNLPAARRPLKILGTVFLSSDPAGRRRLLRAVPSRELRPRLERLQPYAAAQAHWSRFVSRSGGIPAFELRRGTHPRASAEALQTLIGVP